jgi:membrane protein YqaA with SNARE-associated domain
MEAKDAMLFRKIFAGSRTLVGQDMLAKSQVLGVNESAVLQRPVQGKPLPSPLESAAAIGKSSPPLSGRAALSTRRLPGWMLAALVFCESIFIPFPPDPFFVAYGLRQTGQWAWVKMVLWCSVVSTLGGWITYQMGLQWGPTGVVWLKTALGVSDTAAASLSGRIEEWGWMLVLAKGFTPVPYKLVAFLAGTTKMSTVAFLLASLGARGMRFSAAAVVAGRFGHRLRGWEQRHHQKIWWTVRLGLAACLCTGAVSLISLIRAWRV